MRDSLRASVRAIKYSYLFLLRQTIGRALRASLVITKLSTNVIWKVEELVFYIEVKLLYLEMKLPYLIENLGKRVHFTQNKPNRKGKKITIN